LHLGVNIFIYQYDTNRRQTVKSQLLMPSWNQNNSYDDADRLTTWNVGGAVTTQ